MSVERNFPAAHVQLRDVSSSPEDRLIRPPWTSETSIQSHCTGCDACVHACPQLILRPDKDNKPFVDFDAGECTFCEKCALACEEPVFDLAKTSPWKHKSVVASSCLQNNGVSCQLCSDVCPVSAFRIETAGARKGHVVVDTELCTGCGSCVSTCPLGAVSLRELPAADPVAA